DWIVSNRSSSDSNIVYVVHLGDCVENGDLIENEWKRADTTMKIIEDTTGVTDGTPYGIAVGNHDMTPWGDLDSGATTNYYNQYFGTFRFSGRDYYGGHYGSNNDNHYDTLSVGSLKFIIIYMRYRVYLWNTPVLDWADSLLSAHDDRYGIIVSHRLINTSGNFLPQGDSIYTKLRDNENLFFMLCGHYTGEAKRTDTRGGDSTDVVTLLSDFQGFNNGGDGWLRIMRFSPANGKIFVNTYSPTLNEFRLGSQSKFTIDYAFPDLPLPVELAYFTGILNGNKVELRWRTETEVNNYGFEIERSTKDTDWIFIGFVEGNGNSNSPKQYSFNDNDIILSGEYYYRLKQIDNDGTYEYSDVVTIEVDAPNNFYLSQNYPNPFNPETRIDFKIPLKQLVTIRVYNTLGEQVAELVNEVKEAGSYAVTFYGTNLSSGVYIYRLQTSSFATNMKMILLK
ncbi:MAG: T9SS type A sorting domain-containing protein, partial [Ignavibacteria bacterium]|nr:T9SS type A sorting domain-containing protein [Ignavibacteria bacterium]